MGAFEGTYQRGRITINKEVVMICYEKFPTNGSAIKVKEKLSTREDGTKVIEELYKKWDGEYIMRCDYSSKSPSCAAFQRLFLCEILDWLDALEPSSSNVNLRKEIIDDYHKAILPHMERVAQDYVDEKLHYWWKFRSLLTPSAKIALTPENYFILTPSASE